MWYVYWNLITKCQQINLNTLNCLFNTTNNVKIPENIAQTQPLNFS